MLAGYRQLSEAEVAAANEVKALAAQVGHMVEKLSRCGDYDQRWVSIARTELQQGFMALTRAITRPTNF